MVNHPNRSGIKIFTKVYTRHYQDNGQTKVYVEWIDTKGKSGRTEGEVTNPHMRALVANAVRHGLKHEFEVW